MYMQVAIHAFQKHGFRNMQTLGMGSRECREGEQTMSDIGSNPSSSQSIREDVNNHIHTCYSFSPYTPEQAVLRAKEAGLATAGIMDHDTLAGAEAFERAGRRHGVPTTVGMEVRADFSHTPLKGRRINNPDQISIAYVALHAIPRSSREALQQFMKPYAEARMIRNRVMTRRLNTLLQPHGIVLDFDRDILPLSSWQEGGSITERHLLFALAQRLLSTIGSGAMLLSFLDEKLGIPLTAKAKEQLGNPENPHIAYDLLGLLKSALVEKFYVNATAECPDIQTLAKASHEAEAILAYAYLGDVTDSVTGDKKTQAFEDDYLELLFTTLKELGFQAITYMPSRNTPAQLQRLRTLCEQHGFFQISGEDINSPRQAFVCEAMRAPGFENLVEAAWALIGHETACGEGPGNGLFSDKSMALLPELKTRTTHFASLGRAVYKRTLGHAEG